MELKIAKAKRVKPNLPTFDLPLSMLKPINKIQEPHFYEFVKDNIRAHGLYHPLVVHPITIMDWRIEAELDKYQSPPLDPCPILHYRIQCGCNRWYALQELDYDAVECYVIWDDPKSAYDLCHSLRIDKRWQRGSNWENL